MVVRAYKHILRAFVSAVDNAAYLAASIASSLNLLLGTPFLENPDADIVEKISVDPHTYKALTPFTME